MRRRVQSRDVDRHVGVRLKGTRETVGWRRIDLADRIGLADEVLGKIEAGEHRIEPLMLFRAAEVLKVSVNTFFEGSPATIPSPNVIAGSQEFVRFLAMPESLRLARAFNNIDCDDTRSSLIEIAENLSQSNRDDQAD